jgi:hypothetical protein
MPNQLKTIKLSAYKIGEIKSIAGTPSLLSTLVLERVRFPENRVLVQEILEYFPNLKVLKLSVDDHNLDNRG